MGLDGFKYDAYFDKNSILYLIEFGIELKTSFIGHNSAKLFQAVDSGDDDTCKKSTLVSNNVISASIDKKVPLVNLIFTEVSRFTFIYIFNGLKCFMIENIFNMKN